MVTPSNFFPILGHHAPKNIIYNSYPHFYKWQDAKAFPLPTSVEHPLVLKMTLTAGNYYHPSNVNFTAFDSLFFIYFSDKSSPILLIFQMMQNKDSHDVRFNSILAVEELDLPPNA